MKLGKCITASEDTYDVTMQHKVKVTKMWLFDHLDVGSWRTLCTTEATSTDNLTLWRLESSYVPVRAKARCSAQTDIQNPRRLPIKAPMKMSYGAKFVAMFRIQLFQF